MVKEEVVGGEGTFGPASPPTTHSLTHPCTSKIVSIACKSWEGTNEWRCKFSLTDSSDRNTGLTYWMRLGRAGKEGDGVPPSFPSTKKHP